MRFDYRRRARYISGKSFVVGMTIWAVLLGGLFLMDLTTTVATKDDTVFVSTYGHDAYDTMFNDED